MEYVRKIYYVTDVEGNFAYFRRYLDLASTKSFASVDVHCSALENWKYLL